MLSLIVNGNFGELNSEYLWQSFYGKRGDSVFENYIGTKSIEKLKSNGMFYNFKNDNISAVLLVFCHKSVLLENPNAKTPLTKEIILSLTGLPNFDISLSKVRIPFHYYSIEKLKTKSKKSEK